MASTRKNSVKIERSLFNKDIKIIEETLLSKINARFMDAEDAINKALLEHKKAKLEANTRLMGKNTTNGTLSSENEAIVKIQKAKLEVKANITDVQNIINETSSALKAITETREAKQIEAKLLEAKLLAAKLSEENLLESEEKLLEKEKRLELIIKICVFLKKESEKNNASKYPHYLHRNSIHKKSLEDYLTDLVEVSGASRSTLLIMLRHMMLYYLHPNIITKPLAAKTLNCFSTHRLLLICFLQAYKCYDDHHLNNRFVAMLGGVSKEALNRWEITFLKEMNFEVIISEKTFEFYAKILHEPDLKMPPFVTRDDSKPPLNIESSSSHEQSSVVESTATLFKRSKICIVDNIPKKHSDNTSEDSSRVLLQQGK